MNKKIEKKFSIFLSNLSTLNKFKSSLFPFKYNSLRIISPKIPNNIPFAPYPRSNHSLSLLESFLIKPKILFFCCFFIIYIWNKVDIFSTNNKSIFRSCCCYTQISICIILFFYFAYITFFTCI